MKRIKILTESDLRNIVRKTVDNILKEEYYTEKNNITHNYKSLYKELLKYRINNDQNNVKDIELNNVFDLDPSKYEYMEYGIYSVCCNMDGILIAEIYKGKYSSKKTYYSNRLYMQRKHLIGKVMSPKEEDAIVDYFNRLIDKKKKQIADNQYYIEHFDELLEQYLQIAKQYLKVLNKKEMRNYNAYLTTGNSYSDKRATSTIVITEDDSQVGYIKIIQYKNTSDVELDCCYLGNAHTRWIMEDPTDPQNDIECAVRMAT